MNRKMRDFYHIQDKLSLFWRYSRQTTASNDDKSLLVDIEIARRKEALGSVSASLQELIDLYEQKISLLQSQESDKRLLSYADYNHARKKADTEVTLSSSGMGFFSPIRAEETARVQIDMCLYSIPCELLIEATVVECRISPDSENAGYWLRVRFEKGQQKKVDLISAHVATLQMEKLSREDKIARTAEPKT
tara:strand:+ start:140 stop:715 length:576 start_codon:yes stop_codon:yes gene_type:complete